MGYKDLNAQAISFSVADIVQNQNSAAIDIKSVKQLSIEIVATVVVAANKVISAVDTSADTVTAASHGYFTGQVVQLTTSSALPTGLSTTTDYYLIVVDSSTLSFATTLVNANAGTKIDLTGAGAGTNTIVPQAISGGSVQVQKANSPTGTWYDISGKSLTVSATTNGSIEIADAGYGWVRLQAKTTKGYYTVSANISGK